MISINTQGAYYFDGKLSAKNELAAGGRQIEAPSAARRRSMAWKILAAHDRDGGSNQSALNPSGPEQAGSGKLNIRFDALTSHDITYVGIVQTARASGLKEFPLPYVLTNCHNSLCAVGGTINEDDHVFGLSAARKYGGDYVPAHLAVIHQYMREVMAGCGKMILGSDSHTRYGALGAISIGEGGPELVKQLLGRYYELDTPEVAAVYLTGKPRPGVGPQDVALAIIGAVFKDGLVKNKVMEFFGPGVAGLSVEYRMGIDVMTTETTCLSSIWSTDERTRAYLARHGREGDYQALAPEEGAYYETVIQVDLSRIEPMIALPFHPSNVHSIRDFLANADDLLALVEKEGAGLVRKGGATGSVLREKFRNGKFFTDQAVIAGCAGGGFENIMLAARLLAGKAIGNPGYNLSIYPASQPIFLELTRNGAAADLLAGGAVLRSAFCGPCFGAGDVPQNNAFSIRHTTRNFPNREGSQPGGGQMSFVALMDARSIAATALNGGVLTAADTLEDFPAEDPALESGYRFDAEVYARRVYHGWGKPQSQEDLVFGPNIADWPAMSPLPEHLLLKVASAIYDPVTTTDELIPSGETSSYRSNPMRLAEFTLSRKDPGYVERAKLTQKLEQERSVTKGELSAELQEELKIVGQAFSAAGQTSQISPADLAASLGIGSVVFALRPGDGSAREQAASCQKVLGGWANTALEYATKRYRSNLINWGMLPLLFKDWESFKPQIGDRILLPNIRQAVSHGLAELPACLIRNGQTENIRLQLAPLSAEERRILLEGCLINFYAAENR
ncbi:MAG: hydratase [Deltaproteobacteria bacterium]|jgi:aconitate hydratase|nr:hydratase [Deltaproteobacteria bacterium]